MSSTERKASCQSSRSTAELSWLNLVSRCRARTSGSERLMVLAWWAYLLTVARSFRMISHSRRNSVFRWLETQNWKAWLTICCRQGREGQGEEEERRRKEQRGK
jgi:hypothetical protein